MVTNRREPVEITAGDTISFTRSLSDYPASQGWSLKYTLRGGAKPIDFTSTANGDDHVISVDDATTAQWLPADYTLTGFAENGAERHQIYLASFTIHANAEAEDAQPSTTHAQRMLISIEAQLEKMAQSDIIDSSVEGTEIRREARKEIYLLRKKYQRERESEIAQERIKNGKSSGRRIVTRLNVMHTGSPGIGHFIGSI